MAKIESDGPMSESDWDYELVDKVDWEICVSMSSRDFLIFLRLQMPKIIKSTRMKYSPRDILQSILTWLFLQQSHKNDYARGIVSQYAPPWPIFNL